MAEILFLLSASPKNPLINFGLIVVAILLLSFLINMLLSHSILGMSYRIFVGPGVIIHELSHAFLCLITGARITKMSFFDKKGGSVEHRPSRIPFIGSLSISLAPFIIGAVVIFFLSQKLGLKEVNLAATGLSVEGMINYYQNTFTSIDWRDPFNLLIVYLVLSVAVTMTPSGQDIRNAFGSLLIVAAGLFLLFKYYNGIFARISIPQEAFVLLSTVLFLLILSLVLSIVVFVLSKIMKPI